MAIGRSAGGKPPAQGRGRKNNCRSRGGEERSWKERWGALTGAESRIASKCVTGASPRAGEAFRGAGG